MKQSTINVLNAFDQEFDTILRNPLRPAYDVLNYNQYFAEQPPAIRTQNNFADSRHSGYNVPKYNVPMSQLYQTNQQPLSQLHMTVPGGQSNMRYPQPELSISKPSQPTGRDQTPTIDFLNPSSANLNLSIHNQKPVLDQTLGMGMNDRFNNPALKSTNTLGGVNFGTSGLPEGSQFGLNGPNTRTNPLQPLKTAGFGTLKDADLHSMHFDYLNKFGSGFNSNQDQNLLTNDRSKPADKGGFRKDETQGLDNTNEMSKTYNNYLGNVTAKYGNLVNDGPQDSKPQDNGINGYLMSKKVSNRLVNKSAGSI